VACLGPDHREGCARADGNGSQMFCSRSDARSQDCTANAFGRCELESEGINGEVLSVQFTLEDITQQWLCVWAYGATGRRDADGNGVGAIRTQAGGRVARARRCARACHARSQLLHDDETHDSRLGYRMATSRSQSGHRRFVCWSRIIVVATVSIGAFGRHREPDGDSEGSTIVIAGT
jgi:hypothetical protein